MESSIAPLITFGYGRRTLEDCLVLLKAHRVEYVVDVRSSPRSGYKPEFSREPLSAAFRQSGLTYVFMGDELGGRPNDPSCYDERGHVDYLACRRRVRFADGITRLLHASRNGYRVALMCSEGKPETCHRSKLIAEVLTESGVGVLHLDETDKLRSHDEIIGRLQSAQLALLDGSAGNVLHRSRGRYAQVASS
jgi:uncharacterized protein (DUF488 family)